MARATPHALSVAERQAVLRARHGPWQALTLDQLLDQAVATWPDRPWIITDTCIWTYRQMLVWIERLAAGLRAEGVRPGEHVALLMANEPEYVAAKFAIAKVGAVAVPINFLNRRDELAYVLHQSDAVMLLTMDRFRGLEYLQFLDELAPGWAAQGGGAAFPRLRQVWVHPTGSEPVPAGVRALAELGAQAPAWTPLTDHPGPLSPSDIIYTSGTTGSQRSAAHA